MPFITAPNLIEQSDFTAGWAPDGSDAHRGPGELNDVLNLLLEDSTGALVTRKGFTRRRARLTSDSGRYIVSMHRFTRAGTRYIIAVTTTGSAGANNVQLFAINTSGWSATQINTSGVEWANPKEQHWGLSIDGTFYGGSRGNPMYSWDGTTWDGDASTGNWKTLVDDTGNAINTATEFGRNYAFKGNQRVEYDGKYFTPVKGIRYDTWTSGDDYVKGDLVSRKVDHGSVEYWRSFRCIEANTASGTNRPGDGSGSWQDYWKGVRLPLPEDEDGDVATDKWDLVLTAPETSVAAWYAGRLWLRADSQGEKARLAFSAPIKPEKGADIPDTVFDPTDFTPGNDFRGTGGGWVEFSDGKHDGSVMALHAYDQYLVVFKRAATWVLSGQSEQSFTVRRLAQGVGCVASTAKTQHQGLLYFLDDDGLYVTDGTAVEPVAGLEKVRDFLRDRLDDAVKDGEKYLPTVWSWGDFVWLSIPVAGGNPAYLTLAYHPQTGSFWKTDLPVLDVVKVVRDGVQRLFFSTPDTYGVDTVYRYSGSTDDTGAGTEASTAITWNLKTAWWPFGLYREDRRIRRTWALVKGATTYTLRAYRNFIGSSYIDQARVVSASTPEYIEGTWVPDSFSMMMRLSGTSAPCTVHGIAVQTEPRRVRYHN